MSKTLSGEMSVEHVRRYIAERDQRLHTASYPSESAEPEAHIQLLQHTNAKLDHLSVNLERFREELSRFNRLLREEVEGARPVAQAEPAAEPTATARPGDNTKRAGEAGTQPKVGSPEDVPVSSLGRGPRDPSPKNPERQRGAGERPPEPVTAIPPAPYGGRWRARVVFVCTVVLLGTAAGLGFYEWKAGRVAQPAVTTEQSIHPAEQESIHPADLGV